VHKDIKVNSVLRMCARRRADGVFLRFKVSLDNVPRDRKFTFPRM